MSLPLTCVRPRRLDTRPGRHRCHPIKNRLPRTGHRFSNLTTFAGDPAGCSRTSAIKLLLKLLQERIDCFMNLWGQVPIGLTDELGHKLATLLPVIWPR